MCPCRARPRVLRWRTRSGSRLRPRWRSGRGPGRRAFVRARRPRRGRRRSTAGTPTHTGSRRPPPRAPRRLPRVRPGGGGRWPRRVPRNRNRGWSPPSGLRGSRPAVRATRRGSAGRRAGHERARRRPGRGLAPRLRAGPPHSSPRGSAGPSRSRRPGRRRARRARRVRRPPGRGGGAGTAAPAGRGQPSRAARRSPAPRAQKVATCRASLSSSPAAGSSRQGGRVARRRCASRWARTTSPSARTAAIMLSRALLSRTASPTARAASRALAAAADGGVPASAA